MRVQGLERYAGERVGVLGLARSGLAAADALARAGAGVRVFDDKPEALEAARARGHVPGREVEIDSLALLVPSPGVPLTHPAPHPLIRRARDAGVMVRGDVDLFAEAVAPRRIVGITGTNGKSTTTALVHHLLVAAGVDAVRGGNIGEPVLALEPGPAERVFVLELSSFQLALCERLRPAVAVWLNLAPDHLDRHGDLEGYRAAKMRLFQNQTDADHAVVGVDDEHGRAAAAMLTGMAALGMPAPVVLPISAGEGVRGGVFAREGRLVETIDGVAREVVDLAGHPALRGSHNHQNAAAAYAAVRALGVPFERAAAGFSTFAGLPHRLEEVARAGTLAFVNDSKATNPDAAARALASFADLFWIAGGRAKPGGFASLRPLMPHVRRGFLIGEAAEAIARDLRDVAELEIVGSLEAAVHEAAAAARASGLAAPVVLLSPACASFDQFRDYEARGDAFRALARLEAEASA